jgi:hypothetical protein
MPIQTVSQAFSNEGAGGFSFRNKIINGAMEVAQRGTTFTNQATSSSPNGPYTLDRWANNRASDVSGLTVTQSTDAPQGFINSMRLQRVAGNTATEGTFIFYTLAREDSIPLAGETITLSFYAKAGANYSQPASTITLNIYSTTNDSNTKVYLFSPTVTVASQNFTLTTSWQRFSITFTLGSTIKQLGFILQSSTLTGTAGADDSWYATGFQLEEGSVTTPFERRPYTTELQLCQRYYYRATASTVTDMYGNAFAYNTAIAMGLIPFPVTMRVAPSALETSGTATDYRVLIPGGNITCNGVPTYDQSTRWNAFVYFNVASGLTAGDGCMLRSGSSAAGYLGWSAEL